MKPKDKEKSKNKVKSKSGSGWSGGKIAVVVIGVLFVVLMVVSSLGSGWLNFFSSTKTGDTATVSYTVRDDLGRPVLTSDANVFNESFKKGDVVFFSRPLEVQVNVSTQKNLTRIPVIIDDSGQTYPFGLFRDEMNLISREVAGMKVNERKTVSFVMPFERLENNLSREQFGNLISGTRRNISDYMVNDELVLAFSENPIINLDKNTTPADQYFRTFYIEDIGPDGVVIKGGYKTIDLYLQQVKNR